MKPKTNKLAQVKQTKAKLNPTRISSSIMLRFSAGVHCEAVVEVMYSLPTLADFNRCMDTSHGNRQKRHLADWQKLLLCSRYVPLYRSARMSKRSTGTHTGKTSSISIRCSFTISRLVLKRTHCYH